MNIFYNTATKAEAVDEYNWIYTSVADGGSGICTANPATSTCIAPLTRLRASPTTSCRPRRGSTCSTFSATTRRPHYAHQSNLAEERILYLALNSIISKYKSLFATNTPIVQPTYTQDSQILTQHSTFATTLAGAPGAGRGRRGD